MFSFASYTWYICLTHIALAIILFFVVNWLGKHSKPLGYVPMSIKITEDTAPAFNFLFKAVSPVVYLILVAVLFQTLGLDSFNRNIYMIVVYYWIVRVLYLVIFNKVKLTDWTVQIFYWVSSVGLSIWVSSLIDDVGSILPDPKSLLEQFWILVILFIYSILNKLEISRDATIARKEKYIEERYIKLNKKYGSVVHEFFNNDFYEAATFSIMIYEDFNRPRVARLIERCYHLISKKPHTYGIMQVMSSKPLSDDDSLRLGMEKIMADMNKVIENEYPEQGAYCDFGLLREITRKYNGGDDSYYDEVRDIYDKIVPRFFPRIGGDIEISSLIDRKHNSKSE